MTWTLRPNFPVSTSGSAMWYYNNAVYCTAASTGSSYTTLPASNVPIYKFDGTAWTAFGNFASTGRRYAPVAFYQGFYVFAHGQTYNNGYGVLYRSPTLASGSWVSSPSVAPRAEHCVFIWNDIFFLAGGIRQSSTLLNDVWFTTDCKLCRLHLIPSHPPHRLPHTPVPLNC